MSKRHRTVWAIIHCEYMQVTLNPNGQPWMDEMLFHVASSFAHVERYVRTMKTSPHGWWKVERRVVDEQDFDADYDPETFYFNYQGHPRKNPPHSSALRAYRKWQAEMKALSKRRKKTAS